MTRRGLCMPAAGWSGFLIAGGEGQQREIDDDPEDGPADAVGQGGGLGGVPDRGVARRRDQEDAVGQAQRAGRPARSYPW